MSEQASSNDAWTWKDHERMDLAFTVGGLALVVAGAMMHSLLTITLGFSVEVGATASTIVMWRWR